MLVVTLGFCATVSEKQILRVAQDDNSKLWDDHELLCGLLDGLEDAHIAGAPAEVAAETFLDFGECGVRVFVEQVVGGEDHAGGADSALRSAAFEEALLDGVEFFATGEAFDRGDARAFGLENGDEAGVDELSVHEDGAGAALAFAAAFFCSG